MGYCDQGSKVVAGARAAARRAAAAVASLPQAGAHGAATAAVEASAAHDGSAAAPLEGARNSSAALWLAEPGGVAGALAPNDALCSLAIAASSGSSHGASAVGLSVRLRRRHCDLPLSGVSAS